MIIPIYKPLGASTHQLAEKVGALYHTKATHTGTLDPMAEGVVVVLTDQDRFNKKMLASTVKKYSVEIVVGFSTDTDDLLGLVLAHKKSIKNIFAQFMEIQTDLVGELTQIIHPFSAKRFQGSSYFNISKIGSKPPEVKEKVRVHSFKVLEQRKISIKQFHEEINNKVMLVAGNFRQPEVLHRWEATLRKFPPNATVSILTCEITCSKRTYIRSLVRYIATKLNQPMVVNQLIRTQNGPYAIADCLCLV